MPAALTIKLPLESTEAPSILITSIALLFASLVVYIPMWTLAYYPHTRALPRQFVKFARFYSRRLFLASGALAFASTVFTLTISLGWKLYLMGHKQEFNEYMQVAPTYGWLQGGATAWRAELGNGFDVLWASTALQILTLISLNIALRYGIDEKVEWPADSKEDGTWT